MNSVITIRAAISDDIPLIDALLQRLANSLNEPDAYAANQEALRDHGFGKKRVFHTLIADKDGQGVGLCIYFPEFSTWRCQPGIYVQDLYVDPACRGQAVGKRLLSAAISDAAEAWNAAYLRLSVHVVNQDAQAFYQSL